MDPGKGLFCPKPLYDLFMNYLRMLYGLKYRIKAASGRPHSRTVTGTGECVALTVAFILLFGPLRSEKFLR